MAAVVLGVSSVVVALIAAHPAGALPAWTCSYSAPTTTCSFTYTGAEQVFTVPTGVSSITVTATGAAGSGSQGIAGGPGEGAQVTSTIGGLTPGQALYVEVGGVGSVPGGGFNGGGPGDSESGGGGGASDVQSVSMGAGGVNFQSALSSRLIVAGGGGGSGYGYNGDAGGGGGNAGASGGAGATSSSLPCSGGASTTAPGGGGGGAGNAGTGAAGIGYTPTVSPAGPNWAVVTGETGDAGSTGSGGGGATEGSTTGGGGGGGYTGGGGGASGSFAFLMTNGCHAGGAGGGGGGGSSFNGTAEVSGTPTSAAASVVISWTGALPLPVPANPPAVSTTVGTPVTGPAPGLLYDGRSYGGTPTLVGGPSHGMVVIDPAGDFTYTPNAGYSGPDSFSFSETNSTGTSSTDGVQSLIVDAAPSVTSTTAATFAVGVPGTFTVATAGYPAPSLSDGGATLPSGVTFTDNGDGTATLAGTPAVGATGTYPITITATNGTAPAATQSFVLTVVWPPTVTGQPVGRTVTAGSAVTFVAGATGGPPLTVQWQVSTDGGSSFTDIPGATSTTLGLTAAVADNGYRYQAVFSNPWGTAVTQPATLAVTVGYGIVRADGSVATYGTPSIAAGPRTPQAGVTTAATPDGSGYWVASSAGGVFSYGDAGFYGSEGAHHLNQPIVGMAAAPDGHGYWLVARDGGIFAFGSAGFYGSHGGAPLNQPIVGMAATPDGRGYWLVARDGGIFTYGDAGFYGSEGAHHLNQPVVGMAPSPDGRGYWLVARDGGIFAFGSAGFFGSHGGAPLNQPIIGMASTPDGRGYWLVAGDGGIFTYGDAPYRGSLPGSGITAGDVVGMFS